MELPRGPTTLHPPRAVCEADVIVVLSPNRWSLWWQLRARFSSRAAIVVVDHSVKSVETFRAFAPGKRLLYRIAYASSQAQVALNAAHRSILRQLNLGHSRSMHLIANVVAPPFISAGADRPDIQAQRRRESYVYTFIYVGSLDHEVKNVSGLLRSFAELRRAGLHTKLLICGDGALRERLLAEATALELDDDSLEWRGMLPSAGIAEVFGAADCLVSCSLAESDSCVVSEALAARVPVISTPTTGPADKIGPERGIVLKSFSTIELTRAMREFLVADRHLAPPLRGSEAYLPGTVRKAFDTVHRLSANL